MSLRKAEEYRLEARKCLEQAEIAPDERMKKRMMWLADEWLNMAYKASLEEDDEDGPEKNEPIARTSELPGWALMLTKRMELPQHEFPTLHGRPRT